MQIRLQRGRSFPLVALALVGRDVPGVPGSIFHVARALSVCLIGRLRGWKWLRLPGRARTSHRNREHKRGMHLASAFRATSSRATAAHHQHRIAHPYFSSAGHLQQPGHCGMFPPHRKWLLHEVNQGVGILRHDVRCDRGVTLRNRVNGRLLLFFRPSSPGSGGASPRATSPP